MLKALELVGFKSFATKTRFEFGSGVTAVVGPNGSGKSNIVDAIKWVLGEQSVKSLRGKEMADVIFNGAGGRKPVNTAEVTLTFDNTDRRFDHDASEIQITRRVYRSGEGEYLINREPCRLKDIREMLSGTGLGSQAYSIIEQGKVDSLLESSPKDRRLLFEEAAGISRFRSKKLEALRRLDRVEQNLLRLSDIVDEVEHRLRSVRAQAGKARRYREHMNRLQELRTQVGLVDWQRLGEKLEGIDAEIAEWTGQRDSMTSEADESDARVNEIESKLNEAEAAVREIEGRVAVTGESIASHRSTIGHERARAEDLETEIAQHRRNLAAMNTRVGDLHQQLRDTTESVEEAGAKHEEISARFAEDEATLKRLTDNLTALRQTSQESRSKLMDRMKASASLGNEISGFESRIDAAESNERRLADRIGELEAERRRHEESHRTLLTKRQALAAAEEEERRGVTSAKDRLRSQNEELAAQREELSRLRQRQSGLRERADVLQQLQQRHEGLSPGVKEVLIESRNSPNGPFSAVQGVVADLMRVSVESAALIEIALGDKAQHLVVPPDSRIVQHVEQISTRLPGRVGFVWLDRNPSDGGVVKSIDFEGRPGVLGRADRFVETDPAHAALARRLLGRTWIVERLSDALVLAREGRGEVAFVTVAGEMLAADGTLVVGPRHTAAGLISRRSELRAIETQLGEFETSIGETRRQIERLERHIVATQQLIDQTSEAQREAVRAVDRQEHKIAAASEKLEQVVEQIASVREEWGAARADREAARRSHAEAEQRLESVNAEIVALEASIAELGEKVAEAEAERQAHVRRTTDVKIELAKSEERLEFLQSRLRQFQENRRERQKAIDERRRRLAECATRRSEAERNVLAAESALALLYLEREKRTAEASGLLRQRKVVNEERATLTALSRERGAKIQKLESQIHKRQLAANELRMQRRALADRLREDYDIDLRELEVQAADMDEAAVAERAEVQQEIDELRKKINTLGNVNLDALEELDGLEERYEALAGQYKDLVDAKASLERIIERINVDSRRLFLDTFEQIKIHFERLFRNLFGGGQADLVLEEDVDVLDSGVDIIAKPPGKEARNISLLSGGEKTLTCVALLLAIFQNRPSPFCVLDEVDAALDEANIGRFLNVLHEFLELTQFVVVTHSKKTMAGAGTLYGVTMQESGVSKQVSVRFEDVSDDGEISFDPNDAQGRAA